MRKVLQNINEKRTTFIGKFKRYGTKTNWNGFPEKTILLINITDKNGKFMTDHIWFSLTNGFEKLGELKEGDAIQFDARIKEYVKGYVRESEFIDERELDYKLNNPTKIKKL